MSINNRLVNSCTIIICNDALHAVIIDVRTRSIVSMDVLNPSSMSKVDIAKSIHDFIVKRGIDKGIVIHVAVNHPCRNGIIYHTKELESLQKWFHMKYGRKIHVQSIADMLCYRQWNIIGASMKTMTAKKTWLSNSRIVLVYIDSNNASLSMVDSGFIIDGLDFDHDAYCIAHAGTDNNDDDFMYNVIIHQMDSKIRDLYHPDYTYYYFHEEQHIKGLPEKSMVLSHVDPVKDIAESTIMIDRGINSDPDYIIQAKSNYDDIYIPIEDETGKSKSYPLFQH